MMNAEETGVVFKVHGVALTQACRVIRKTFSLSPDSPPLDIGSKNQEVKTLKKPSSSYP